MTELKAIAVEQSEIKVQPNSSVEIAGINKKINLAGYLSNFFPEGTHNASFCQ